MIDYGSETPIEDFKALTVLDEIFYKKINRDNSKLLDTLETLKEHLSQMREEPFIDHSSLDDIEKHLYIMKDNIFMAVVKSRLLSSDDDKYFNHDYRRLRGEVFRSYENACMKCGSTRSLHCDHIKPVSKYPALFLDKDNMQILCKPCNLDKSNKNENDYRRY
tara:strand:- start:1684 stop:2172 length:489 start_codon:yes stop_codon:yes gene_type:complete